MFRFLRELRSVEVDPVQAFGRLPDLPEAARMQFHRTQEGDPHRHRRITPRMILKSVHLLHHERQGEVTDD